MFTIDNNCRPNLERNKQRELLYKTNLAKYIHTKQIEPLFEHHTRVEARHKTLGIHGVR